ncbi:MAG: phosphate ABC transporter permease PstA [Coriobacteriia bacterium]|nr:phosphate ABC transporter permease PstA [Coriobacteriia bacterium]
MSQAASVRTLAKAAPQGLVVNPRIKHAHYFETAARIITGGALVAVISVIVFVLGYILYRGIGSLSWEFISTPPQARMTEGGILPALIGTLWLVLLTAVFALPVGIATGIYLSEFAKGRIARFIRVAIANMAGVPSVIYGLFGFAAFSIALGFSKSLLAMGLTLTCVTLPVIITATEEALKQLPKELRLASLALGATRWRTTWRIVVPTAAPGIITGSILGLSRAAGETAPILFTGVAFFAPTAQSLMQPSMALPYHLYIMATQPVRPAPHIVWGTALVLVGMLSIINAGIALWRSRKRKKLKW